MMQTTLHHHRRRSHLTVLTNHKAERKFLLQVLEGVFHCPLDPFTTVGQEKRISGIRADLHVTIRKFILRNLVVIHAVVVHVLLRGNPQRISFRDMIQKMAIC
uniref:Putative ovule protein n=1 Tax=Solanum chacoense TaxID=4108 RepID=A0A0V0H849_SOLCH